MMNTALYMIGKQKFEARFEKAYIEASEPYEVTSFSRWGWDGMAEESELIYPEIDEDDFWEEMIQKAYENDYSDEEYYFAIVELGTEEEEAEFLADYEAVA